MNTEESFVLCDNLVKIYKVAELEVVALQGLDLEVPKGEIMALVGPSGAGKSTLLNVIGGLDTPSAGAVKVEGWDLLQMKDRDRVKFKKQVVGFAWQQPSRNLLPYLTARENIELPMILNGVSAKKRKKRSLAILDLVDLADRANFRPDRLSGGQQQRVGLAVALANNPPLLLGDELTGQIDSHSSSKVYDALRRINKAFNTTIILVTHDPLVSSLVDRVVAIRDGRTSTEIRRRRDQESGAIHEEEWVILDQAGRLQLPKPFVDSLNLRDRVKVRMEDDHVTVWPESIVREFIRMEAPKLSKFIPAPKKTMQSTGSIVTLKHVWRTFRMGSEEIHAVKDVSLEIPSSGMAMLRGRSGSGKTTLLNLIAGLDEPTQGSVYMSGQPLAKLSSRQRVELRRRDIGFIFQTFGLLPFLTVEENVEVSLRLLHTPRKERKIRVSDALEMVGLSNRAKHRTYELSGGEQQRVSIARALVNQPTLILADEPTGQLDSATGANIIQLLRQIADQPGVTVITASHDANIIEVADVVFNLQDGRLVSPVPGDGRSFEEVVETIDVEYSQAASAHPLSVEPASPGKRESVPPHQ
jgi:peptide/nickel transport system ATP-binding protein